MKKLCFLLSLFPTLLFGQSEGFKVASYSIGFGGASEMYKNMSMDFMRDVAVGDEVFQINTDGYDYIPYAALSGTLVEGNVSLTKRGNTGVGPSQQIRLGMRLVTNRESMVSFAHETELEDVTLRDDIVFCLVDDELGFSGEYLWRQDGKRFAAYAGFGMNLSATMNSALLRIRGTSELPLNDEDIQVNPSQLGSTESFDAKAALFWRLQVPIGVEIFALDHVSIGAECRFGTGGQQVIRGNYYGLECADSFTLRMSYHPGR